MVTENGKLNVFFLTYFAPSHIIPMVDIARLFATRGVAVTIISTAKNATLFQDSIDQDIAAGRDISIHKLNFPAADVGLPEGVENYGQCSSPDMIHKVSHGVTLIQKTMEQFIRDRRPDCLVSDMFFPWTADLTEELKIPRIIMYPSNSFFQCVQHCLKVYAPYEKVESDEENFLIPGLPDKIEMRRSEIQDHIKTKSPYGDLINAIKETECRSYGVILNSFRELEPGYFDLFKKIAGVRCWNMGPLYHFANRGKIGEANKKRERHSCLSWLDTQKPNSVIYVCFGSMAQFSDAQLTQIALGLESAGHPFLWVAKTEGKRDENWLPKGFDERIAKCNSGVIIRDWAPQIDILHHPSVGGFLNHCGWNSFQESITAGLPLISWPLFAEHFYNSKLATQVLKVGVEIGPKVWNSGFQIKSPLVGKEELANAIKLLMGDSGEAEGMKRRAKEIAVMAKKAVEEGGSSYNDLTAVIEDLKSFARAQEHK